MDNLEGLEIEQNEETTEEIIDELVEIPTKDIGEEETTKLHKLAVQLNSQNVIVNFLHLASEDYSHIEGFTIIEVENINDVILYKTKYENDTLIQLDDYTQEYYDKLDIEEQKYELKAQLRELDNWFNEYDMQIKQYERDVRLGISGTYHIGEDNYTISQLDNLANEKAQQINTLRTQLNNL